MGPLLPPARAQLQAEARQEAHEDLLQFVYLLPIGVIKFSDAGQVQMVNPTASRYLMPLLRRPRLDNVFTDLGHLVPDLAALVAAAPADLGGTIAEHEITDPSQGEGLVFSLQVMRVAPGACMALLRDVTQRHRQDVALAASEQLLQSALDNLDQAVALVDASGHLRLANRRVSELLGLPPKLLARHPHVRELLRYQQRHGEFAAEPELTTGRGSVTDPHLAYERRRPDGKVIDLRTRPLPDGGFIRTFTDVTARVAAEEMLSRAASEDPATGLANRTGLYTKLDLVLAETKRLRGDCAVLCIDLDHFKALHEELGHEAGDAVLLQVAERLRSLAGAVGIAARIDGDGFALLLPATPPAAAEAIAEQLLATLLNPYPVGERFVSLGASIGLACAPADGNTAEELVRAALQALRRAKAAGGNRWRNAAAIGGERERRRRSLTQALREAIGSPALSLAYQPICAAGSGAVIGYEALARWTHPEQGAISPASFIPLAEQSGLIRPLGRWVIETACAEAAAWAKPLRIAVNLSPAQFRDRELTGFITAVLARTGLAPERLELEVTEGLLLQQTRQVQETMRRLRELGVRLVLDDFGTAHASLGYLRAFPFDGLKIDSSFTRALQSNRKARKLVEAILAIARSLSLAVVCEGVETPEQLSLLRSLQCDFVQGWLLGRPGPAEAVRAAIGSAR